MAVLWSMPKTRASRSGSAWLVRGLVQDAVLADPFEVDRGGQQPLEVVVGDGADAAAVVAAQPGMTLCTGSIIG